jgi:thiol-disulfide isomerase/thioredoxin
MYKQIFTFTILFLFFFTNCSKEKNPLVDTDKNELIDIESLSQFQTNINQGVSVVFFHASWCSICASQRPAVEAVSVLNQFNSVFFGEVEFEENQDINSMYNISGFPTIVFYKDGNEEHRMTGRNNTEAQISSKINELL